MHLASAASLPKPRERKLRHPSPLPGETPVSWLRPAFTLPSRAAALDTDTLLARRGFKPSHSNVEIKDQVQKSRSPVPLFEVTSPPGDQTDLKFHSPGSVEFWMSLSR